MKYITTGVVSITVAGGVSTAVYRGNSIFDPQYTLGGTTSYPQGATGYQNYSRYRVLACTAKLILGTPTHDFVVQFKVGGTQSTNTAATVKDWLLMPKTRLCKVRNIMARKTTASSLGLKWRFEDLHDPSLKAIATVPVASDPPDNCVDWVTLRFACMDAAIDNATMPFQLKIYQKVLLTDSPNMTF